MDSTFGVVETVPYYYTAFLVEGTGAHASGLHGLDIR